MVPQDNIWQDLGRLSRILGMLLTIVGGFTIAFEGFLYSNIPPADGFIQADAIVLSHEQRGTFREPAFALTIQYMVEIEGTPTPIHSGRRVEFEYYNALADGDSVLIEYNPQDPFEWRMQEHFLQNSLNDYALGVLMVALGILSGALPTLIRLAAREDDFQQAIQQEHIKPKKGSMV